MNKPVYTNTCIRCGDKFDTYHPKHKYCPACEEDKIAIDFISSIDIIFTEDGDGRIRKQKDGKRYLMSLSTHTIEYSK